MQWWFRTNTWRIVRPTGRQLSLFALSTRCARQLSAEVWFHGHGLRPQPDQRSLRLLQRATAIYGPTRILRTHLRVWHALVADAREVALAPARAENLQHPTAGMQLDSSVCAGRSSETPRGNFLARDWGPVEI